MHNLAEKARVLGPHTKEILFACRDAIRADFPTAGIVLYGSQARGQADAESDMDLLVLLNEDVTPAKSELFVMHSMRLAWRKIW